MVWSQLRATGSAAISRCVAASTISAVAAVPAPYPVHAGTPCPVCLHPCLGFRLRCESRGLPPFAIYPCAVVLVFVSRPLDGHGNLVLILYYSPVLDILPLLLPVCGLCYGPSLLGPRRLLRRRPLPCIVPRRPWSFSFYRYPSRFRFPSATGSHHKVPLS